MNSTKTIINQHRKKKYVFKERESPFPVPIASITREAPSKNYWYQYTGKLQGDQVIVTHSGDISYLQRMGFFGKGLMSRGAPAIYKNLPNVHIPSTNDSEPDVVQVMRRRMYLKHMKWKKSHDRRQKSEVKSSSDDETACSSADEEFDSDVDYTQTGYDHEGMNSHFHQADWGNRINTTSVIDTTPPDTDTTNVAWQKDSINQNTSTWSWNEECSKQEVRDEVWENQTINENAATDSWDNMEADEDFWATEDVPCNRNESDENNQPNTNETALKKFDNSDTHMNVNKRSQDVDICSVSSKKAKLCKDVLGNFNDVTNDSGNQVSQSGEQNINNSESLHKHLTDQCESDTIEVKATGQDCEHVKTDNISETEAKQKVNNDVEMKGNGDVENFNNNNESNYTHAEDTGQPKQLPVHPYCIDDDADVLDNGNDGTAVTGDEFLVIDDSDIDDSAYVVPKRDKYSWLPVKKREIFHFNEPLMLSLEEAYFLSYGLGCLTIKDENDTSLTLSDLWCRFCTRKQFLPRYVAYHYFRSKGWVPKPTILFGTDFLVYKVGPEFYHASYSVIIRTVYEGTFEEVEEYNTGKVTWTSFFGVNRVTEQVAKTLVYCYVIMPKDLSEEEKKLPDCIARFKIRLQAVQRWVSAQERDREKLVDEDVVT